MEKKIRKRDSANRLRAVIRLAGMATYTVSKIGHVIIRGAFIGNSDGDIARLTGAWSRGLCRIMGVESRALGNVPPMGALLVSNHRSYIDIVVIGNYLPCSFLAKAELKSWPLLGWAATAGRTVYVHRESTESRRKSREEIKKKLSQGISFVVFPEGTTAKDGLLPFKPGIFKTAAEEQYTIVPVAIEYDDRDNAWVDDDTLVSHIMRTFGRKRVSATVTFGDPIRGSDEGYLLQSTRTQIINALNGVECGEVNAAV